MGFVGDILGLNNGSGGATPVTQFKAQPANLLNPVSVDQAGTAYGQAQTGINSQAQFLAALQAQNGLGNQASVFQQQQALANQLQGVANGTGPNPALQQLQNTTGQNVQNQAALMASQRGVGANPGLLARQAALQGAQVQQQAVGQGAALQAQQQLAGMNALQQQQSLLGGMANQQVSQLSNGLSGYNQAAQSEQQNLLNAIAQQNNANVAMTSNMNNTNVQGQNAINAINAEQTARTQNAQGALFGGLLNGLIPGFSTATGLKGSDLSPLTPSGSSGQNIDTGQSTTVDAGGGGSSASGGVQAEARGGLIRPQPYDLGGSVQVNAAPSSGPQSNAGRYLFASSPSQYSADSDSNSLLDSSLQSSSALSSTGAPPSLPETGGGGGGADLGSIAKIGGSLLAFLQQGGTVGGQAKVKGDSLKNDTVPAMLSPGEIVIPRHVVNSKDPVGNAAKFVAAVMAKKGRGLSK